MRRYPVGFFLTAATALGLGLLYRAYPCPLTALLTPVRGSGWELGKLLYWPYLPGALAIWRLGRGRDAGGGHCLLLVGMPLALSALCTLLPGATAPLWVLVLGGGLLLHRRLRRVPGGELLWVTLAILLGIAYLLLTVSPAQWLT